MKSLLNKEIENYTIIKECHLSIFRAFVIGYNKYNKLYVVWKVRSLDGKIENSYNLGTTFDNEIKAYIDFYHRINKESEIYEDYYKYKRTFEIQNE